MLGLWNNFDLDRGMANLFGWDPFRALGTTPLGASPVEVTYEGDRAVITADLPGVDPDHVDVTFERGTLSIAGQRGDDHRYRYAVELGDEYDGDTIEAELDKGVLTIKAEKRPEAKPRKIALKAGDAKRLESGEAK